MTVTPLSSRDHRTSSPTSPPSRRANTRRRRGPTPNGVPINDPAALTVTFEISLTGATRYRDALEILDTLRDVTDRLGIADLEVASTTTVDAAPTLAIAAPLGPSAATPSDDDLIRIMPDSRSVVVAGEEISLTRVEFDLLTFLAEHPRRVFGRSQLLKSVWGYEHAGQRTVDVHIRRIRAKLGDRLVTTVRSVGYRLSDGARVTVGTRTSA
jgi:hypothetical protein